MFQITEKIQIAFKFGDYILINKYVIPNHTSLVDTCFEMLGLNLI